MDYSKLAQRDIERKATFSRRDEVQVKRAGFEHRMDRAKSALKNANSPKDVQKYNKIIKNTERIYNKYSGRI